MSINTRIETRRYEFISVLVESSVTHSIARSDFSLLSIRWSTGREIPVSLEKTIKSYQLKSSINIVNLIRRGYAEYNVYII